MIGPKDKALRPESQPVVDELVEKFSRDELAQLARYFKFNVRAADAMRPSAVYKNNPTLFFNWLLGTPDDPGSDADGSANWRPPKKGTAGQHAKVIAVYVAEASFYAAGHHLLELKKLAEAKLKLLEELLATMRLCESKDAKHLLAYIKYGGKESLQEAKDAHSGVQVTEDDGDPN